MLGETCELCSPTEYIGPLREGENAHRECLLRSVIGGIGHLIAHDYWCTQKGDPDAGLTYRQSALLVDEYVAVGGSLWVAPHDGPWGHPGHNPVQHRDRKPPWCNECGWSSPIPAIPATQWKEIPGG